MSKHVYEVIRITEEKSYPANTMCAETLIETKNKEDAHATYSEAQSLGHNVKMLRNGKSYKIKHFSKVTSGCIYFVKNYSDLSEARADADKAKKQLSNRTFQIVKITEEIEIEL